MDVGVSSFDLHSRVAKFEAHSSAQREREARKLEKERILQQRAEQRRAAHEQAVNELRRRQAEEAEQVQLQLAACTLDASVFGALTVS